MRDACVPRQNCTIVTLGPAVLFLGNMTPSDVLPIFLRYFKIYSKLRKKTKETIERESK